MRWYDSVPKCWRLIAATLDEITGKYRGCVMGKEAKGALEIWAPLECGKYTAHPVILSPEIKMRAAIRRGDPDTWLELRLPWRPCC